MTNLFKKKRISVQYCPSCDEEVVSDDINIKEGVALCSHCGSLSQLSDLNYSGVREEERISNPPKGVSVESDRDSACIKVSLFSIGQFIGGLFATLFWNGIVSVFLSFAVASVWYQIFGYVADWIPVPGLEDGKPVMNDEVMGVGMTIFLCAFLTPFVIIGLYLLTHTLLSLMGSTKVVLTPEGSYISTGIGFIRWKKRFDPNEIKRISLQPSKFNNEGGSTKVIELEAKKPVRFGSSMKSARQEWLIAVLKTIILKKKTSKYTGKLPQPYWINH